MDINETRWMMRWGDEHTVSCDWVYLEVCKLYVVLAFGIGVGLLVR